MHKLETVNAVNCSAQPILLRVRLAHLVLRARSSGSDTRSILVSNLHDYFQATSCISDVTVKLSLDQLVATMIVILHLVHLVSNVSILSILFPMTF